MTFCGLWGLVRTRRLPSSASVPVARVLRLPGSFECTANPKVAVDRIRSREAAMFRSDKSRIPPWASSLSAAGRYVDGLFSTDTAYRTRTNLDMSLAKVYVYILKMNADHLGRNAMANSKSKDVVVTGVSSWIGWELLQRCLFQRISRVRFCTQAG